MNQERLSAIRQELERQDRDFADICRALGDLGDVMIELPQTMLDELDALDELPPITIPRFPAPPGVRV